MEESLKGNAQLNKINTMSYKISVIHRYGFVTFATEEQAAMVYSKVSAQ